MIKSKVDIIDVGTVTVKGHTLDVRLISGLFTTELEDGTVVSGESLVQLKAGLSDALIAAVKEVRPSVACLYIGYGSTPMPALYVGARKGPRDSWRNIWMFDVGVPNKKKVRENLAQGQIEERIFKPSMDLAARASLVKSIKDAQEALEKFDKANRFDPTKGGTVV